MILYFVSLDFARTGAPGTEVIVSVAIGVACGMTVQMLLWPWRAEYPLRRLVGESWVSLSDYLEALLSLERPQNLSATEIKLRLDIDHARKILRGVAQRDKKQISTRLEDLNFIVTRLAVRVGVIHNLMDAMRGSDVHRSLAPSMASSLLALVNVSRSVALTVVSRQPSHFATCRIRILRLQSLLQALRERASQEKTTEFKSLVILLDQLAEVIDTVEMTLGNTLDRAGERALFGLEITDLQTWQLRPLAAAVNLSAKMDPYLVRYGLRMSLLCGIGTFLFLFFEIPHGYWLPFTVVMVMQPDYGSTRQRAFDRVVGTVAGSLAATLLLGISPSVWVQLGLIACSLFGFAYFIKRNYTLSVFCITQYIILLMEYSGQSLLQVELERIIATIGGGLLAMLAAQVFWAVKEEERFPVFFRKVLLANQAYLRGIQKYSSEGRVYDEELLKLKHETELAAASLFQSVGRLYTDPRMPRQSVELLAALTNGNQRVFRIGNLLLLNLREGMQIRSELAHGYFDLISENLGFLGSQSSQLLNLSQEELLLRQSQLDKLPIPEVLESLEENMLVSHLARATTEIRAMLTELMSVRHQTISPEQKV